MGWIYLEMVFLPVLRYSHHERAVHHADDCSALGIHRHPGRNDSLSCHAQYAGEIQKLPDDSNEHPYA